ncbi:MAG: PKD domain-containing protein [Flavobacteriales bacterium]|nr:PKD domain-containing protein [Flavobacteriales bacterium]
MKLGEVYRFLWVPLLLFCGISFASDAPKPTKVNSVLANFFVSDTVGCAPLITQFTNISEVSGEIALINWDFGDGESSTNENPWHIYESSGVYSVTLSVTTADGDFSSVTKVVQITIFPKPEANFSFTPNNPETGVEVEFSDLSSYPEYWIWNFGDGTTSTDQNPTHTYNEAGNYKVSLVVGNDSCSHTISKNIIVTEDIIFYVPNTFTPNNDGMNDQFKPIIYSGIDPAWYSFTVFDRWGGIVFETDSPDMGWDGPYKSFGNVQDGIYIWRIEFSNVNDDIRYEHYGHVVVLN